MQLIFHAFERFVGVFLVSGGFFLIARSEVADLKAGVTIDSLGPGTIVCIEVHTDEIQYEGKESHLGVTEERDDDGETRDKDGREERDCCADIRF